MFSASGGSNMAEPCCPCFFPKAFSFVPIYTAILAFPVALCEESKAPVRLLRMGTNVTGPAPSQMTLAEAAWCQAICPLF